MPQGASFSRLVNGTVGFTRDVSRLKTRRIITFHFKFNPGPGFSGVFSNNRAAEKRPGDERRASERDERKAAPESGFRFSGVFPSTFTAWLWKTLISSHSATAAKFFRIFARGKRRGLNENFPSARRWKVPAEKRENRIRSVYTRANFRIWIRAEWMTMF